MMIVFLVIGLLVGTCAMAEPATAPAAREIRVMSFNVRNATLDEGENAWPRRRELLLGTIQRFGPDLLGTQECVAEQVGYLRENLGGYGFVGVGREDGKRRGEYAAMFFRADRYAMIDSGTFWLSQTPEVPGSKSWDAALARIVTWAKLRVLADGRTILWLNTHWDHAGAQARLESAGMMQRWIREHAGESAVIITGDFNEAPGSAPYLRLLDARDVHLTEVYSARHPADINGGGSFHEFTGKATGWRIDWIFCSDALEGVASEIDTYHEGRQYPSDHFPLTAVLRWR